MLNSLLSLVSLRNTSQEGNLCISSFKTQSATKEVFLTLLCNFVSSHWGKNRYFCIATENPNMLVFLERKLLSA